MYRLASQHHTSMEMIQQVSDETMKTTSMGGGGISSITIASSSSKRVVKALNQPVGLGNTIRDSWMEQKKVMEKEHKDSISWLKGLEVLYANTFVVHLSSIFTENIHIIDCFNLNSILLPLL